MFLLCLHSVFAGCFTYLCDFHWEQAWKSWVGPSHGVKNPTELLKLLVFRSKLYFLFKQNYATKMPELLSLVIGYYI